MNIEDIELDGLSDDELRVLEALLLEKRAVVVEIIEELQGALFGPCVTAPTRKRKKRNAASRHHCRPRTPL